MVLCTLYDTNCTLYTAHSSLQTVNYPTHTTLHTQLNKPTTPYTLSSSRVFGARPVFMPIGHKPGQMLPFQGQFTVHIIIVRTDDRNVSYGMVR